MAGLFVVVSVFLDLRDSTGDPVVFLQTGTLAVCLLVSLVSARVGGVAGLVVLASTLFAGNPGQFLLVGTMLAGVVCLVEPLRWSAPYTLGVLLWFSLAAVFDEGRRLAILQAGIPLTLVVAAIAGILHHQHTKDQHQITDLVAAAQRARQEERQRLAADLHDIVAHNITLSVMLSTLGPSLEERERVDETFQQIEEFSRAALADMRRLFGVLDRTIGNDSAIADDELARESVPLEGALQDSAQELRRLGREVALVIEGDIQSIPSLYQYAFARSLTELTTNVAKYGEPGTLVNIVVTVGEERITLEVRNRSSSVCDRALSSGIGLLRIQERAALLGGYLSTSCAEGVWSTLMSVPLEEVDDAEVEPIR